MNRRQRVLGKGSSSDGLGRVGFRDYKEKGYHMVNERHAAMVEERQSVTDEWNVNPPQG